MSDRAKPCPTCNAQPGEPCVSGSKKPTSIHHARIVGVQVNRRNVLKPRKR